MGSRRFDSIVGVWGLGWCIGWEWIAEVGDDVKGRRVSRKGSMKGWDEVGRIGVRAYWKKRRLKEL